MSVARLSAENLNPEPKRAKMSVQPALSFSNENKVETIQPHDDTLVFMLKIGGGGMM